MRHLFGSCGFARRQDVPVAQDSDAASGAEDSEAWMACRQAKRAKAEGGGRGNRDKPVEGGRANDPINRRTGGGIAVTRVIASTTTLPSAREKGIGTVAPPPRWGRAKNRLTNPTPRLPWKLQSKSEVRRSRPLQGQYGRMNKPFPPLWKRVGNSLCLRRKVWWSWTLE